MKKLNLKAMVPLTLPAGVYAWLRKAARDGMDRTEFLGKLGARDPGKTEWASQGFCGPIYDDDLVHDLDGAALLMAVQFNKRILPAAVRNEKLEAQVKDFEERQGREIRKDEYAKMRDDIEASLLPQAFIRRTLVPFMLFKDRVFVFSSSHATVDAVALMLIRLIELHKPKLIGPMSALRTENGIPATLRCLAVDAIMSVDEDSGEFQRGKAIKLKGGDNRSVAFKDRDLGGKEVQMIVKDAQYSVTEMAVIQGDPNGQDVCSFTLTQGGAYKAIKLADGVSKSIESQKDQHAVAWLMATTLNGTVKEVVALCGGLQKDVEPEDEM